ncbi:MAG: DUF3604 domain-containing protein [Armatimonadetes bacterium]|nr:DUF3604 domain-containing protein [Armatimonadota bacterium]
MLNSRVRACFITILAVLVVALHALSARGQTGQRLSVLANGGFEQGLTGWRPAEGHQLIEKQGQAHSGSRCLFGEVTRPNQAHILRRDLQVRPGKLYEFEIWARATGGTKLVLWVQKDEDRRMIASWQGVGRRWRRYTAPLGLPPGRWELQIVAPSSFGAPAGKMWIDDIAVYEYDLPPSTDVSQGQGFNDWPAMVCTSEGSAWLAWISFRDGADTLQCARALVDGDRAKVAATWQIPLGSQPYVLAPSLGTDGRRVWLVYALERGGNWDIWAVSLSEQGPGEPVRVTTSPAVDVNPTCAVSGDTVWIAWESNRDDSWRQIYLARLDRGRVSRPRRLSKLGCNNYSPSVAVAPAGRAAVVWYSFRDNNFDLYAYDLNTARSQERRLTSAPTIDRDPRLVSAAGSLWLAWDNANSAQYHLGAANRKRVEIAQLTPSGLRSPQGLGSTILSRQAELADLALDSQGRLWVAARVPRDQHRGWDVVALAYSGDKWSSLLRVARLKGMARRPWLGFAAGRLLLAYQGDDLPVRWSTVEESTRGDSGIYLATLNMAAAPPPQQLALVPYEGPTEEFPPGQLRVERGEDRPPFTITYRGRKLHLYFGDLHEHTDISPCNRRGDQTQDQSYQSMRDIARYDFAALTDHGYGINHYLWTYLGKIARANNDPGRFLTFLAEEWTSTFEKYDAKHPYGYYGHRNLIFEDPYYPHWFNAYDGKTPAEVWEILGREKVSFVHIPHQLADTGNVPVDWSFVNEKFQPVAEIFQTRGSYEYYGAPRQAGRTTPRGWFIQDAWARGIVIGVIAAPDHGGGYGKAAVYAPELTRKAVLEAIRQRHTYGTTAAKIWLDVRVNGHLMGEKIPAANGQPVRIEIRADCPSDIERVEVCRNNQFIYTPKVSGKKCSLTFVDNDPPKGPCYYYVRVIQKDQEIAWSSPVWLGEAGPID